MKGSDAGFVYFLNVYLPIDLPPNYSFNQDFKLPSKVNIYNISVFLDNEFLNSVHPFYVAIIKKVIEFNFFFF